jgi:hypothetical protein
VVDSLVPQREPLSPPLLAVACALAALPAAWLAVASDTLLGSAAGSLLGFGGTGVVVSPWFTLAPAHGWAGAHPATLWIMALLSGPVGAALLGLLLFGATHLVRTGAWLRVLALEWAGFAVLRLPALLIGGVVSGDPGPVNEIYRRLGEPQSGRWAVALLALLALWSTATAVSRLALRAGSGWMRTDGRPFRRRLVRIVAGYPAVVSLAGWSAVAAWAAVPWMVVWVLLTLAALHALTP